MENITINTNISNYNIGYWCKVQRGYYKNGLLSQEKVDKLNSINFSWSIREDKWYTQYYLLKDFIEQNGHYPTTTENQTLYSWIRHQMILIKRNKLDKKKEKLLVEFEKYSKKNKHYEEWLKKSKQLKEYIDRNKRLPTQREPIGMWLSNQKALQRRGELQKNREKALEKIGITFGDIADQIFTANIIVLSHYIKEYKHLPDSKEKYNGLNLGDWCSKIKLDYHKGLLTEDQKNKLTAIGFDFKTNSQIADETRWKSKYNELIQFIEIYGRLPKQKENPKLQTWLFRQKKLYSENKLPERHYSKLEKWLK